MTYYRLMEEAVRELMIDKGLVTADDIRAEVEAMDARSPANGALVVARAWTDPDFKKRLIASPKEAIAEVGHDIGPMKLIVLENTPEVHNVVVCTLCSCYPRWILGIPPDWYKSRSYRSRVVREPRAVLREFGTEIADNRAVRVRHALHGPADAARGHGRHERGSACRPCPPGFDDRGDGSHRLTHEGSVRRCPCGRNRRLTAVRRKR